MFHSLKTDETNEEYYLFEGGYMKEALKKLWQDESAQGATEYILMLVVVVSIAMVFKDQLKSIITGKVESLGTSIQSFE